MNQHKSLNGSRHGASSYSKMPIKRMLSYILLGTCCFYGGLMVGMSSSTTAAATPSCPEFKGCPECPTVGAPKVERALERPVVSSASGSAPNSGSSLPPSLSGFLANYGTIPRDDFLEHFDIGVPIDDTKDGQDEVLIFYSGQPTLPNKSNGGKYLSLSAEEATQNCLSMKVILQGPYNKNTKQCVAIVPQWESYYVHKYMRVARTGQNPLDAKLPLRYVSRSHNSKGQFASNPDAAKTKASHEVLVDYLQVLEGTLERLKPIAVQAAGKGKTIVVLVCNLGQSELFLNFVCGARAKGLDLSNLLMFATDKETYQLSQELGIAAFYDETIFADMPTTAANHYGDRVFARMMMAKVYCVHLVNQLGYNVLFQDVDVVWYRNPLPYFEQKGITEEWDMMFQDDGARSDRYAPYSPNTGFYYVKYNDKTRFFFTQLLRMGDVVAQTKSHQAALTAVLNEHASWKGLRVKVWKRGTGNQFPGGFEYHRLHNEMRALLQGNSTADPYIFHMSWTTNKDNKKKFLEQMGQWYKKEGCDTKGFDCCLAKPNVICHYRDKPSSIPCRDSPPIDKGRKSFW